MLRRLESLFDPTLPPGRGLAALIVSDYLAYYVATPTRARWGVEGTTRTESPRRLALLFLPRLVANPCLHATVLVRLAMAARGPMFANLDVTERDFALARELGIPISVHVDMPGFDGNDVVELDRIVEPLTSWFQCVVLRRHR